jgi:uncharacterized protein YbjT (DUF2867 family)
MKVALLGATGFVGSALLKEALNRGHIVTAIVRHPEITLQLNGMGDVPQFAGQSTRAGRLVCANQRHISGDS